MKYRSPYIRPTCIQVADTSLAILRKWLVSPQEVAIPTSQRTCMVYRTLMALGSIWRGQPILGTPRSPNPCQHQKVTLKVILRGILKIIPKAIVQVQVIKREAPMYHRGSITPIHTFVQRLKAKDHRLATRNTDLYLRKYYSSNSNS
ncbi:hypothetical protein BG000_005469 [Podila horticola]|nr:hypothetical protein BG000_005469 [Podila horticola]